MIRRQVFVLRISATFLVILSTALGACRSSRSSYSTETFLSSHEGRILSGVIIKPESRAVSGGEGCDPVFYSQGELDNCDVKFCDYLDSLREHFNVSVIYHIVSNERPSDSISLFNSSFFIDSISELRLLNDSFLDLNKNMKSNLIVSPDFTNAENFHLLLFDLDSLKSISDDKNFGHSLSSLQRIALAWRNSYKREMVLDKLVSTKQCHLEEQSQRHSVHVEVNFQDEFCSDRSNYCSCMADAHDELQFYHFAQDLLFAQKDEGKHLVRTAFKANGAIAAKFNVLSDNIAYQIGVGSKPVSKLSFAGGNMLVNSKLIFLGRDILASYLDQTNDDYQEKIDAIDLSLDEVTKESVTRAFEEITDRQVIWVGTEKRERRYTDINPNLDSVHQPVYHIDLFMALLKWGIPSPDTVQDTLYYVLSVPDTGLIDWSDIDSDSGTTNDTRNMVRGRTLKLRHWIIETGDSLEKDLLAFNIIAKRVTIPMPLSFQAGTLNVYAYYSFNNGLAENRKDSSIFYMTQYGPCKNSFLEKYFYDAKLELSKYVTPIPILGPYENRDGLHCSFLVTERED